VAWAHRGTSHTEPQTQSWRTLIKATRYPSGIGCGATRPTRASVGAVHDPSATHRCATHHEHRVAVARAAKIVERSAWRNRMGRKRQSSEDTTSHNPSMCGAWQRRAALSCEISAAPPGPLRSMHIRPCQHLVPAELTPTWTLHELACTRYRASAPPSFVSSPHSCRDLPPRRQPCSKLLSDARRMPVGCPSQRTSASRAGGRGGWAAARACPLCRDLVTPERAWPFLTLLVQLTPRTHASNSRRGHTAHHTPRRGSSRSAYEWSFAARRAAFAALAAFPRWNQPKGFHGCSSGCSSSAAGASSVEESVAAAASVAGASVAGASVAPASV